MKSQLGLKQFRQLFYKIRGKCDILVSRHAFADYPERGFSEREIVDLVRNGTGRIEDNKSSEAIGDSYLFFPKDDWERECKLVVLIEVIEIEGENPSDKKQVIVCSAYRETKK